MIGLDTSAIIDFFKGDNGIKNLLKKIKGPLCTTQMNYLELMFGIDPGRKAHKKEESFYDEFFDAVTVIELDMNSCKRSARILWDLKKKGKTISKEDCVIAALLLNQGVNTIITKNKKHFERIPGIKVITY